MSSSYRRICLNHTPPLRIDWDGANHPVLPIIPPDDHSDCRLALTRTSGSLVEIWLPTPYYDKLGQHAGRWYDVSWMRDFPAVVAAIMAESL